MSKDDPDLWRPMSRFGEFGIGYERARHLIDTYAIETRERTGRGGAIMLYVPDVVRLHYTETDEKLDPQQERAKLARAQREKVRVETEVFKGNLIPKEDVKMLLARIVHAAKAKFESLPTRAAAVGVGMNESELHGMLTSLVRDCLGELASGDVGGLGSGPGFDGEPMGGPRTEAQLGSERGAGPVEH